MLVKGLLLLAAWRKLCVHQIEVISLVGATLEEDVHREIAALRAQLETVKQAARSCRHTPKSCQDASILRRIPVEKMLKDVKSCFFRGAEIAEL